MTTPLPDRRDLDSREQIATLVQRFYADVAQDDLLGPIFNDVARVDWPEHLEKLTDFWCRILLHQPGYTGNPLTKHEAVHAHHPFTQADFDRWLRLFRDTLHGGWRGPLTQQADEFAGRVAKVHGNRLVGQTLPTAASDPVAVNLLRPPRPV